MFKKAVENIIRNIDIMGRQKKEFYQDMFTKMVQQDVRDEELKKLHDFMKEVDYAEPGRIFPLYENRMNELQELEVIAQEVAKEYKEGKTDPNNTNFRLKKKGIKRKK